MIENLQKKDERYSVKVQAYDKDNNYTLLPDELSTTIVDILEDYNHTTDSDKYRVTYTFTDRANNAASVSRDFEFTNDPYAPSVVSFTVLDSAKIFLEGENSIYQTEVSSDETALVEPLVSAYYAVSSGNVYVGVEKQAYLLSGSDENSTSDADLAKYNKVNYHKNSSGQEFYVDLVDGNLTQKSNSYPKNIVSYSAKNQFGREYIYDLEIRVQDTTPPDFVLSQNPNLNLEVGQPYNDFNHSGLEDNYDTTPSLTRTIIYDGAAYYGPNGTEPYDHFSQEGFWESGVYQITYSAKDDFDNEQNKTRTITISDTTPTYTLPEETA